MDEREKKMRRTELAAMLAFGGGSVTSDMERDFEDMCDGRYSGEEMAMWIRRRYETVAV